jgi:hypothetical protein
MSDANNSDLGRLFFWFMWLSGLLLAMFLLIRFFYFSLILGQHQLAIPFFLAFLWQGVVQTTALKRYQHVEQIRDAFIIQLVGSLLLVLMVGVIVVFRS